MTVLVSQTGKVIDGLATFKYWYGDRQVNLCGVSPVVRIHIHGTLIRMPAHPAGGDRKRLRV